ncbi:MAG: hypothetical protein L0215_22675 [Gemmataceae bacterium]|nr:hypothetical protein [Gemmataceae bacterium]
MILNDAELKIVKEQLSLAESALASLRRRVTNERNFAIYAEGPLDQIAELKAEIDTYQKTKKNRKAGGKNQKRRGRKAS